MIDLILNMKYAEMKQEGIILEASFSGMEELKLSEKEISILLFNKSRKSPASIAKSNKQWVGLACIRRGTSPS